MKKVEKLKIKKDLLNGRSAYPTIDYLLVENDLTPSNLKSIAKMYSNDLGLLNTMMETIRRVPTLYEVLGDLTTTSVTTETTEEF